MTTIALALVMAMIAPLASADDNNAQGKHDDSDKSKCPNDDDKSKCPNNGDKSTTNVDNAKWQSDIEKAIALLTKQINQFASSSTGQSFTGLAPTTIYTHLDVGNCTIDPITLASRGWCPDGIQSQFFILDSSITQYSVISTTSVPPVPNPLTPVQCSEQTLNYTIGTQQGFGVNCNFAPLPGSGLNYVVFNPSPSWYTAHKIKP